MVKFYIPEENLKKQILEGFSSKVPNIEDLELKVQLHDKNDVAEPFVSLEVTVYESGTDKQ